MTYTLCLYVLFRSCVLVKIDLISYIFRCNNTYLLSSAFGRLRLLKLHNLELRIFICSFVDSLDTYD